MVFLNGEQLAAIPLDYAGSPSQFAATVRVERPGVYEVQVWASDARTGNTGMDRTTFIVGP